MADISVPEKDQKTLGELATLDGDRIRAIVDALTRAEPALLLDQLAARVAPIAGISETDAQQFVRVLATMYRVRIRHGFTIPVFIEKLVEFLKEAPDPNLAPTLEEPFREYLQALLSIESLHVTAKALDMFVENERLFCEPRVMSDMRPVFGIDDKPLAAVGIHTLRITYHEACSGNRKEFFVALSGDDLRALKKVVERAERKEEELKSLAAKAELRWLDLGES